MKSVAVVYKKIEKKSLQIIWQTGKNYYRIAIKACNSDSVKILDFIEDMNKAYSACDLLVARAGATTIAELTVLGIPAILDSIAPRRGESSIL
ncbi:MAG: hypothetical protein MZV64_22090 [Ignavibacteriales bacterium]|nr:hypothetical protein [Ignavibacteriales bacterium]